MTAEELSMQSLEDALPTVKLDFAAEDWDGLAMIPWFSFRIHLPERPLPAYASRPALRTERLVIRPITMDDLPAFHELRLRSETQAESTERGRAAKDEAETRQYIERLHEEHPENWYFGIFLADSGEMIGEGGLPDMNNTRTGYPEAEVLLKKEYWRQGYGREFWKAWTTSFWDLPRETRRHQLMPAVVPDKEPGDTIMEGIGITFESHNDTAKAFFNSVLGGAPIAVAGSLETFDFRDGRQGSLVTWIGTLVLNPHALSRVSSRESSPEINGDEEYEEEEHGDEE